MCSKQLTWSHSDCNIVPTTSLHCCCCKEWSVGGTNRGSSKGNRSTSCSSPDTDPDSRCSAALLHAFCDTSASIKESRRRTWPQHTAFPSALHLRHVLHLKYNSQHNNVWPIMCVLVTHGCSSSNSSSSSVFMMSVAVGEDKSASWTHILLSMARRGGQLVAHTHLNASENTFHCARMCMLHSFLVFKATATSWADITYLAKDQFKLVFRPKLDSSEGIGIEWVTWVLCIGSGRGRSSDSSVRPENRPSGAFSSEHKTSFSIRDHVLLAKVSSVWVTCTKNTHTHTE